MDSGNSSSLQSSSGGDEEAESNSTSFLGPHAGLLPHHPSHSHLPPASSPRRHGPFPPLSSFFDPLSSYLDAFARSPPAAAMAGSDPLLNLDMSWAAGLRALGNSNCTDGSGLLGSALPPRHSPAADPEFEGGLFAGAGPVNAPPSPSSSLQLRHHPPAAHQSETPRAAPARNSRKRSRASRRAPTTVLTTDTTNFRAMVQEFTGIPSPPFPSAHLFAPRSRLDLFHAATTSPATRSPGALNAAAASQSLLSPFAQKLPLPSLGSFSLGSSSSSPSAAPAAIGTNADASIARAFPTNNSAANTHPPPGSFGDQHGNLLSMFSFQPPQSAAGAAARSIQEASRTAPPTVDYAVVGVLRPASDGTSMPSLRGPGGGGDDLLKLIGSSGGSQGGG